MRRRQFLSFVAMLAPSLASAQRRERAVRIGYLAALKNERLLSTLTQALRDLGYIEGDNLVLHTEFADGRPELLDRAAETVVAGKPDIIVTVGNAATRAAERATATIPVVFAPVGDALRLGLIKRLPEPDRNLTGLSIDTWGLNEKRLELLKEAFPNVRHVAVLGNLGNPSGGVQWELTRRAGEQLRLGLAFSTIRSSADISGALNDIASTSADALHVLSDGVFDAAREQIVAFANQRRLIAIYEHRAFSEAGGLMSYGPNLDRVSTRAAYYVDRILRGSRPKELPVEQPTQLELVVNLRTARATNIEVPPTLMFRADEVIE